MRAQIPMIEVVRAKSWDLVQKIETAGPWTSGRVEEPLPLEMTKCVCGGNGNPEG